MVHIHITGFARCGTTLLKNLFVCFKDTYVVAGETSRVGFVTPRDARHSKAVVTKHPNDVEKMEQLMSQPDTHIIFLIRDPRDRVCSTSGDTAGRGRDVGVIRRVDDWEYYCVRLDFLERFRDQVLIVKYEDIIQRPGETQRRIADYCELEIDIPFAEGWTRFSEHEHERQLRNVMNGLRPLDDRAIGRWEAAGFREIVQEYVANNPLVQSFIEEFYPDSGCENPQREV